MDKNNTAKNRANDIRNLHGLGQRPIADIFALLEDIGIYLFKKPFYNSNLSAVFVNDNKRSLVVINSDRTLGHQIFSVAHELSHYYYDKHIISGACSINKNGQKNETEQLADLFASHFLMPDDGVISVAEKRVNKDGKLDLLDIIFIQQYFGVSWSAMLTKLEYLKYIDNKESLRNVGIKAFTQALRYNTGLIEKTQDTYISKQYIEKVIKCRDSYEISDAKAKEILKDVNIMLEDIIHIEDTGEGEDNYED